jgi:hypothetical protein
MNKTNELILCDVVTVLQVFNFKEQAHDCPKMLKVI